ncbi:MAG TPA: SLC13 family permease, partial [Blastocatellia bacterium]|nr:SLC13 family permease [Blastocatellia bacterium]
GSDTVLMISGLFVMTEALVRTGIVEGIGRWLHRFGGSQPFRLAVMIMIAVAALSAFISNTAATAVFVPAVIALARRAKVSASKLLMPLAFASILTSSVTLISTSTNIVISGLMTNYKMAPMGMFELAPVGIPITIAGLIYMFTLGMKLLPSRAEESLEEDYHLRDYLTEIIVLPESPLIGLTLEESKLSTNLDLVIMSIVRGGRKIIPHAGEVLQAGDNLLAEARADDIIRIKEIQGLEIKADVSQREDLFNPEEAQLVEVMVMPGSELRGQTLNRLRFRHRYGLTVLAINRRGETLHSHLSTLHLRMGDVLLLQGSRENIQRLASEGSFAILSDISERRPRSPKARLALIIFAVAIAVGTFKLLPFAAAIVIGAFLMMAVR